MLKELISDILRELVVDKDAVQVEEIEGDKTLLFQVTVGDEDKGRVIGRKGRTINSIRAIAAAVAKRDGRRAHVELVEEGGGENGNYAAFDGPLGD